MTYDAPIMMSAPMVQACMRQVRGEPGGKTQTRRMPNKFWDAVERRVLAGEPVRLWVRETWAPISALRTTDPGVDALCHGAFYAADHPDGLSHDDNPAESMKWTPSIHMHRWASRLTLLDVTIRRERLGDISDTDAISEGIDWDHAVGMTNFGGWRDYDRQSCLANVKRHFSDPRDSYRSLWNHLHGPGSWDRDANKEVMVIGFRPVLGNIDSVGGAP